MNSDKASADDLPFYRKVLIAVGVVVPILLLLLLFGAAFKVLLLVLAGALVAILFRSIAVFIHDHTPLSTGWSLLASVLGVLGIMVALWFLLVPAVGEQARELVQGFPEMMEKAHEQIKQEPIGRQLLTRLPDDPKGFIHENADMVKQTFGVFSSTFGVLADIYIVLLLGMFFTVRPEPYADGIFSLIPKGHRSRARAVWGELHTTLARWLKGKLLSMLIVAVLTALGLWALGMPMVLFLSLLTGLLCFVPNFGPVFSMIPAVLIGMTQGPQTALYVFLLYVAVQVVESNLITPFIQREMVRVPLAMIIIAQVLMGVFVGGLGLILATPILTIVVVLVRMLYVEDVLGGGVTKEA